jgi:hypothetical protein
MVALIGSLTLVVVAVVATAIFTFLFLKRNPAKAAVADAVEKKVETVIDNVKAKL